MVELAFTHLGYFLKVASEKLIFCVLPFFVFLVLQFAVAVCVEICLCGIPMFNLVF